MRTSVNPLVCRQIGLSLVELMVAMVVGLLAMLVVVQVSSFFEAQKRSTTSGADAQTNGAIALYSIARDIQASGYGLLPAVDSPLECSPAPVSINGIGLSPVVITDAASSAADGLSDSVAIRRGSSMMAGVPTPIKSIDIPTKKLFVEANIACESGNEVILIQGATCAMTKVSPNGVSAMPAVKPIPPAGMPPASITVDDLTGAVVNGSIVCLGDWTETVYDVSEGFLRISVNGGLPVDTIPGVVSMQAQYGISAAKNLNLITQWVDATGGTWANPSVDNRNRIKAVRLAIVARSGLLETEDVSAACSSVTAAAPTGVCAWDATSASPAVASPAPTVDLSNTIANWQRYRYRVYETIIPLRNMIWSKGTF
jgi:type IV pilus assembly protein PilW